MAHNIASITVDGSGQCLPGMFSPSRQNNYECRAKKIIEVDVCGLRPKQELTTTMIRPLDVCSYLSPKSISGGRFGEVG